MKAHQAIIRERIASENGAGELFGAWWTDLDTAFEKAEVREISSAQAAAVILEYEWLGRMPQAVTQCWGLLWKGNLAGALVFAEKPGSNLNSDATSIVPKDALYLARGACVHWSPPNSASFFINAVCRRLGNVCVLAYSDPAAGEIGTIYQALGWVYIGASKGGQSAFMVDGKLIGSRSFNRDRNYAVGQGIDDIRAAFPKAQSIVPVPRKHRYIGIYGSRKYRKGQSIKLAQHSLPYPKREVK